MLKQDYDRYDFLKNEDGTIDMMPFIPISEAESDITIEWIRGKHRLEKLADKYYSNPFYDFLILYANPQYMDQFDIPDHTVIRIPFPLERARNEYENKLKKYKEI
jgi:hypothetical protein